MERGVRVVTQKQAQEGKKTQKKATTKKLADADGFA